MKTAAWFGTIALMGAACIGACESDDDSDDNRQIARPQGGENGAGEPSTSGGDPTEAMAGSSSPSSGGAGAGSVDESPCATDDGQCIFRHDTFGDERLWTDTLRLHEVVQMLPPTAALKLGLKVDAEAVPADVLASADLEAPETTVALLELGAVVGVRATVLDGEVTRIGITCALCHSSVDDSVAAGIGKRLDGHPNRQLDPGAIIAATPGVGALAESLGITTAMLKTVLNSWGPGRYDARTNQDGESFPVLIPPAYGLADVALETYTGEGPISYWNAYVAVTQMGAQGTFVDEDLNLAIHADPDLVTPKLPALREYQFSLLPPAADPQSFDAEAAERGDALFEGAAQCATCHAGETYTDAPTLHEAEEIGAEPNEARRSKTGKYRTTPLRGVSSHPPFFHDGSAETLEDVVSHYDTTLELGLTADQQADLVEYLKSL
jgi:mono/diheme cytochrome c family protein